MKYQYEVINNFRFSEIMPVQLGSEACKPEHSPTFTTFNYVIHYVYKGKGTLRGKNSVYTIEPGQAFVMFPYQTASHVADSKDPWEYSWIEFGGASAQELLKASGLTIANPIITDAPSKPVGTALANIIDASRDENPSYQHLLSLFWSFFDEVLKVCKNNGEIIPMSEIYINQAISYIHSPMISTLNVNKLASLIGIDRSYLTQLFKQYRNVTPKQYITTYKMEIAKNMLNNPLLTLYNISESLGYADPISFAKAFKNHHKVTISEYREKSIINKKG